MLPKYSFNILSQVSIENRTNSKISNLSFLTVNLLKKGRYPDVLSQEYFALQQISFIDFSLPDSLIIYKILFSVTNIYMKLTNVISFYIADVISKSDSIVSRIHIFFNNIRIVSIVTWRIFFVLGASVGEELTDSVGFP